jgi:ketosteroid isomerase-like protein
MADNVEMVRAAYEAFARGDLDAAMELAHDDFLWQGTTVEGLPGAGLHEGKDAIRAMLVSITDEWDKFELNADEYVAEGDCVVVLGHLEGHAKPTKKDVRVPIAHVWKVVDGRLARVTVLGDTAVLAAALNKRPKAD